MKTSDPNFDLSLSLMLASYVWTMAHTVCAKKYKCALSLLAKFFWTQGCRVTKCYTVLQICYAILKVCSNFITMHFSVTVCDF